MEIIILGLAFYGGLVLLRKFITHRGILAVRAAWYLILLSEGKTEIEANVMTKKIDEHMPTDMIHTAKDFIRYRYNGKQLPMIAEARRYGFWD